MNRLGSDSVDPDYKKDLFPNIDLTDIVGDKQLQAEIIKSLKYRVTHKLQAVRYAKEMIASQLPCGPIDI